ncbi:MAG: restriction endonuclease [Bacteroidota bacterium]
MTDSKKFENLITSIVTLLKASNQEVISNYKMKDPDNPTQDRQVDIAIKNASFITHVECRLHDKPQDVKWVEELMGRKLSLNAHSMIGVSASGFTSGAIKKAKAHNIELREMVNLEHDDITSWGKVRQFEAHYFNSPDHHCPSSLTLFQP